MAKELTANKINICGIPYEIIEKEDEFQLDTIHWAYIDYFNQQIKVNAKLKNEARKETLCHEIVHGILYHLGYNDLSNDEQFVQALGNAINQTFEVKK